MQAWRDIWEESGVRAGSVEEMRDWVKKHNALIESIEEMRDEERQLSVMVSDIQESESIVNFLGIDSSSSARRVRQDQPELSSVKLRMSSLLYMTELWRSVQIAIRNGWNISL